VDDIIASPKTPDGGSKSKKESPAEKKKKPLPDGWTEDIVEKLRDCARKKAHVTAKDWGIDAVRDLIIEIGDPLPDDEKPSIQPVPERPFRPRLGDVRLVFKARKE